MSATQLLYSHTRPGRILLLKAFSASQVVCWTYMGYATYDIYATKKSLKKTKLDPDASAVYKVTNFIGQSSVTKVVSWLAVGIGFAMSAASGMLARQTVKSVHLVNRNRIIMSTYGFPWERNFTVPVSEIQSVRPQASPHYLRLRVHGEPIPYIIDRDGSFPLPKLFHAAVAPSHSV
ncbi:uncharacterized protein LOC100906212 [Galendromus occidentalis]|uniref:Uncharacterized protein LOC100906212 n=1 Tax=Galendromus occidentalis TaxID=34638 RepID=A0AAJ6QTQ7_9ACAR|nr:uncharacterized protein LOC100906212 [Galendromus occidentalis]